METKETMKVTFYGTRGSVPIANPQSVVTGGNTTCLRIESQCLPKGTWLVVDAGSGFVPLCYAALKDGIKALQLLFTHYHWDHTQGLPLGPLTFIKPIPIHVWGTVDEGLGPRDILEVSMKRPVFPVDFSEVASHFFFHKIDHPNTHVILIHPEGGVKMMDVDQFEGFDGKPLPIGKDGRKYPRSECLVVRMMKSYHPEKTISYRFEEGPTGKVFVILTDHENQDALSTGLKAFLKDADLLAMDSQYSRAKYENQTAGFGHGTPDYCVRVALEVGAKQLGLTHHDPASTDKQVEEILAEARRFFEEKVAVLKEKNPNKPIPLTTKNIFACRDYQTVTL